MRIAFLVAYLTVSTTIVTGHLPLHEASMNAIKTALDHSEFAISRIYSRSAILLTRASPSRSNSPIPASASVQGSTRNRGSGPSASIPAASADNQRGQSRERQVDTQTSSRGPRNSQSRSSREGGNSPRRSPSEQRRSPPQSPTSRESIPRLSTGARANNRQPSPNQVPSARLNDSPRETRGETPERSSPRSRHRGSRFERSPSPPVQAGAYVAPRGGIILNNDQTESALFDLRIPVNRYEGHRQAIQSPRVAFAQAGVDIPGGHASSGAQGRARVESSMTTGDQSQGCITCTLPGQSTMKVDVKPGSEVDVSVVNQHPHLGQAVIRGRLYGEGTTSSKAYNR